MPHPGNENPIFDDRVFLYPWRLYDGPDMYFDPIIIVAIVLPVLLMLTLMMVGRIRSRGHLIRTVSALISQDQYEYTILDIRNEGHFAEGHIPHAVNVPFEQINDRLPTENMFQQIYVYGQNRRKVRKAVRILDKSGYFNVTSYGAYRGWKGPIETT